MLEPVRWRDLDEPRRAALLRRPAVGRGVATRDAVAPILAAVRAGGDRALRELTERFDHVRLEDLAVGEAEREAAAAAVSPAALEAMRRAIDSLTRFHAAQGGRDLVVETLPGVRCERVVRPIARVGLYVPGGSAALASTVLMLGVPARIAGCPTRVLCVPPRHDGTADPGVLVAAELVGIDAVFKVGGAQAVAAMAYGTESVPKVDKVLGPGNAWVTTAKQLVAEDPDGAAIDMPAGPSEVLVVADEAADPALVASDLLSQAEHGPDSQVVLVAVGPGVTAAVARELREQLASLGRAAIAEASLAHAVLVEVADTAEALAVSNRYAPEHLVLQTRDARALVVGVESAGSVFVGPWSPESVGDYASGTNHVLPTYGHARAASGLGVEAFQKTITVQELSPAGLAGIAPTVETLAGLEGLDAHRRAVELRRVRVPRTPPFVGAAAVPVATRSAPREGVPAAAPSPAPVSWPAALARPAVRDLAPYRSARSSVVAAPVLLDANESPWSPSPARPELNRYPAPQPTELVDALSRLYGVPPGALVVGRGTDDVIDWLLRAFCEAREDGIIVCPPTYGVYSVYAGLQGAAVRPVPLGPPPRFEPDPARILAAWRPGDKLVFLCSPNNPTGGTAGREVVVELARALADRALVVLDEAYVEFASSPSLAAEVASTPNLVVLRTLSKAFGLAGARCGAGIAHPGVVELLHKVRPPYPLARPAVEAVLEVLAGDGPARAAGRVADLRAERARLAGRLAALPSVREVFPSEANFLLARFADAAPAVRAARAAGIVVRDRSGELGLEGCVRVTVGTPAEDDRLVAALAGGAG